MNKPKLIRITTVPISLDKLLSGQLNFMQTNFEVVAVSSEKEYLERVGLKENVRTFHLEMSRKITPINDLIAVVRLFFFLLREKPAIVHTHTPKAGIVGMLASFLARVPCRLHTIAGLPLLEEKGLKRKVLNFVEKLTYACATKIYPNSFGLKDIILEQKFCNANKIKVIVNGSTNGIDTSFFSPSLIKLEEMQQLKLDLNIAEDDFVFVFVGRLVKDKGINELVTAFEDLHKLNSKAKLLLVGDYESDLDPLFPEVLNSIKENPAIISVGFQYDVRPYFSIADVLVFPSYREGFPNVVMQAGAMGLPSIVSDINGCNEIIENNSNGFIIPVKDSKAVFEKMKLYLYDDSIYTFHKSMARDKIESRYQQSLVWEAILLEYKFLMNN
jgi:glycosyltransferase involved in cell wall biosynthesis